MNAAGAVGGRVRDGGGPDGEAGAAIVEFVVLVLLLMVPLVYVVLTVFAVQNAAYAAAAATREAGRVVVSTSPPNPQRAADQAAALSLGDFGLTLPPGGAQLSCPTGSCSAAGSRVVVHIHIDVPLPLLPHFFAHSGLPTTVGVDATHVEYVDQFRAR